MIMMEIDDDNYDLKMVIMMMKMMTRRSRRRMMMEIADDNYDVKEDDCDSQVSSHTLMPTFSMFSLQRYYGHAFDNELARYWKAILWGYDYIALEPPINPYAAGG